MTIGDRIRLSRETRGYTATDLALKVGVTPTHMSRLEHGRRYPTMDTLLEIAKALGVKPSYLLDGAEEPNTFAHLPAHLKEFVANSENIGWIEAAYKASCLGLKPKLLMAISENLFD